MEFNNLLLYTDGSFRDRKAGWGFHGYFYQLEPMKSKANLKAQPTAEGYKDVPVTETCTVVKYIDGFGRVTGKPTNNTAELMAVIKAFEFAETKSANNLKLFLDSDYVRLGLTEHMDKWIRNNWMSSKGTPVKNVELWQQLNVFKDRWSKDGFTLELFNVKGHSGDLGNDKADMNAMRGAQVDEDRIVETDSIEINRVKKIEISPLILETRLLFATKATEDSSSYYSYNLGEAHRFGIKPKDAAKDKLSRADLLIGRRISEATLSVYKGNEPEDYLEFLKDLHRKGLPSNEPELAIINLANACGARHRQQIESMGLDGLIIHPDIQAISTPEMVLISKTLNPPRLAFDAVLLFNNLEQLLESYLADNLGKHVVKTDITDVFYKLVKKKDVECLTLRKHINSQFRSTDVEFELKGVKQKIKLALGLDIPTRNQLNKIGNVVEKVELLVSMTGPESFSYSTIFKTTEGSAIYSSPYVQLIMKT